MLSRTAAVFAAAGIVLASPLAAAAAPMTDPVDLGGAYVYDSTGVVGTDSAAVIAARASADSGSRSAASSASSFRSSVSFFLRARATERG